LPEFSKYTAESVHLDKDEETISISTFDTFNSQQLDLQPHNQKTQLEEDSYRKSKGQSSSLSKATLAD